VNVDVSVLAERPRLGPFKAPMAERLARALGLDVGAVNVKAKSNEGMGFVGRGEGIAALAVAQIERGG
jgi:2-C-methyl-D-erythritol 2,4-cyclodiphosphate synthase